MYVKLHYVDLVLILMSYFLEYLCKAEYLSVDPYMRLYMGGFPEPSDMVGTQVAR